jgi:hypothetical protein
VTTVSHASDAARPCFSSAATASLTGVAAARMPKARRTCRRGERRRSGPAAKTVRHDFGGARNAGRCFQESVSSCDAVVADQLGIFTSGARSTNADRTLARCRQQKWPSGRRRQKRGGTSGGPDRRRSASVEGDDHAVCRPSSTLFRFFCIDLY